MPPWLRTLVTPLAGRPAPKEPLRSRRPQRKAVPPDFQRARLYRWEAEHVFPHDRTILALEDCRILVADAYRWAEPGAAATLGWAPPEVTDGRGRRHACGSRQVIKLPRWARTRPIVLHECAHGLAPDKHGPIFVRVYTELLVTFAGLDRLGLMTSMRSAGVQIAAMLEVAERRTGR
jgi:hypothetical protein